MNLLYIVYYKDIFSKRNLLSQKFYKKAALFVLRAIAKHSPELASIVVYNDGLQTIVRCLEDFDPGVKEAAAWALGYIARHNKNLAQAAVDAGKIISINVSSAMKKRICLSMKYFLLLIRIIVRSGTSSRIVSARTRVVY